MKTKELQTLAYIISDLARLGDATTESRKKRDEITELLYDSIKAKLG